MAEIRRRIESLTGRAYNEQTAAKLITTDAQLVERSRNRGAEATIRRAQQMSQVGPRFTSRKFESFEVTDDNRAAYDASVALVAGRRGGLGLVGRPGLGKTHLAGSIANALIDDGRAAIIMDVPNLLSSIRATYDPGHVDGDFAASERSLIRRCAEIPILILDDMGKELVTAWSLAMLYSILNARYEQNLSLIVTSNLTLRELNQRYAAEHVRNVDPTVGASIIDRLVEMTAPAPWVGIEGQSYRFKIAAGAA